MNSKNTAVITAASKGMGAAIARELFRNDYNLILMSSSESIFELAKELDAESIVGSVTNPDDLKALSDLAMNKYGRIDAVVNNTGHPQSGDLLSITDEEWYAGMDMVLLNVVRMARLVTPLMQDKGGSIVNISTFAAYEPSLNFPVSSALRAALGSYVKMYSDQYAGSGIRMNNVLPGFIDTYDINENTRSTIPMGRSGKVEEIAKTVAFLLSPDAGYITGQNIRVDGGLTRSV